MVGDLVGRPAEQVVHGPVALRSNDQQIGIPSCCQLAKLRRGIAAAETGGDPKSGGTKRLGPGTIELRSQFRQHRTAVYLKCGKAPELGARHNEHSTYAGVEGWAVFGDPFGRAFRARRTVEANHDLHRSQSLPWRLAPSGSRHSARPYRRRGTRPSASSCTNRAAGAAFAWPVGLSFRAAATLPRAPVIVRHHSPGTAFVAARRGTFLSRTQHLPGAGSRHASRPGCSSPATRPVMSSRFMPHISSV